MRRFLNISAAGAACLLFAANAWGQTCAWTHWATDWSDKLIRSADQNPPNKHYASPNWDYTDSVDTLINLDPYPLPAGGTIPFHWFVAELDYPTTDSAGNGGIYQELTVQPGVPLEYSVLFTAQWQEGPYWVQFYLIDGPFNIVDADTFSESANMMNSPYKLRSLQVSGPGSVGWTQWTHDQPAHIGDYGPRPQTITPTGNIATVVLKTGHVPFTGTPGSFDTYWDNVEVRQNGGPNLVVNGDFEDAAQATVCDNTLIYQDSTRGNYFFSVPPPMCEQQHTTATILPVSAENTGPVVLTVTGTFLELVTGVQLVPPGGGPSIDATSVVVGAGPNETSMDVTFDVTGKQIGNYTLVTTQGTPCLGAQLAGQFELACPASAYTVSPAFVTDPTGPVELRIIGPGAASLVAVELNMGRPGSEVKTIPGANLTPDGDDLLATFDLGCAPRGTYRLSDCLSHRDFQIRRSLPATVPVWQPWGAGWSKINQGEDVNPDEVAVAYDATNWDYDLSESTALNLVKDLPPGGGTNALHWFLDTQGAESNSFGSGGFHQEIPVTPGVPLDYSFYWKGKTGNTSSWFEFVILDGPFSGFEADDYPDNANGNSPYKLRRKSMTSGSFEWELVSSSDPADAGPDGPRSQTITPTGSIATIVFKSGALPVTTNSGVELLLDSVTVSQGGGPNLLVNGDMESPNQLNFAAVQTVDKFSCESNFWFRDEFSLAPAVVCGDPRADADFDGDVDQADFARFQLCLDDFGFSDFCTCLDQLTGTPDGQTDQTDFAFFKNCTTAPDVPHAVAPNPNCADQP